MQTPLSGPAQTGPDEPLATAIGETGQTGAPPPDPGVSRRAPYLLLAAIATAMLSLTAALAPIRDIDLYWHLIVGGEILDGTPVALAGRGWSMAPVADDWVSTQWLAETLFAWLERHGGLQTPIVYRAVTALATMVTLGLVTLHRRPVRAGAWMFLAGAICTAMYTQERSQQLTFILAPIVGYWVERTWRSGRPPRWWVVLPLVLVWSNYHGGWLIVPLGLGAAALARVLDHGWRDRAAWIAVALSGASVAVASVAPAGVQNAVAALRFSSNTSLIAEWGRVTVWTSEAIPVLLLLLIAVFSWSRGAVRPSRGELVLVLILFAFGATAWRSTTPAVLMLAPVLTGTLARALGDPDPTEPGDRPGLLRTSAAIAVVGAIVTIALAVVQTPLVAPQVPQSLIAQVRATTAPQRVLNDYNIAGPLLWFGGPPPHVQVAIDGRADRFGAAYIDRYNDVLLNAKPGWTSLFDELDPTAAIVRSDQALAGTLMRERKWLQIAREDGFTLLRAPDAPGWAED